MRVRVSNENESKFGITKLFPDNCNKGVNVLAATLNVKIRPH